MARPKKQIDENLLEGLANIGCTDTEIAKLVGCSVDTLNRRFAEKLDKGRHGMKMRLRRAQLKAAESGNVVMLIWLGKQYLGQTDKTQLEHSGPDGGPIHHIQGQIDKVYGDSGETD